MVKTSYCEKYPYPQTSYPQLLCGYPFQAVFIMRALIVSGVSVGSFCNISAAAPATTGVAMLVPLKRMYLLLAPVLQMLIPKAEILQTVTGLTVSFESFTA